MISRHGVIFINVKDEIPKAFERILAEHVPVILANADTPIATIDQVFVDNHQGGYLAGQYLLSLNHRRVGCITLFQSHAYQTARIVGFRQTLAKGNIELTEAES